jgi:aryl-alcohol dehydrogenase-like predicted oxidoreductase
MKLILGGAQFGLSYGATNATGAKAGAAVLEIAAAGGIDLIDAAAAYGDAEAALGALGAASRFGLITKTLPFRAAGSAGAVIARLEQSFALLGAQHLAAVLVHHAGDLAGPEGVALWAHLTGLKAQGRVGAIGFSAYLDDDTVGLARRFAPDIVQLPASLLDQRPAATGVLAALADLGVAVHARSIFLQGRLLADAPGPGADAIGDVRRRLAAAGVSPMSAALGWIAAQPAIDAAVVGVTTADELDAILQAAPVRGLDWPAFAIGDEAALDPRMW